MPTHLPHSTAQSTTQALIANARLVRVDISGNEVGASGGHTHASHTTHTQPHARTTQALTANARLARVDVSGNEVGASGGRALLKALMLRNSVHSVPPMPAAQPQQPGGAHGSRPSSGLGMAAGAAPCSGSASGAAAVGGSGAAAAAALTAAAATCGALLSVDASANPIPASLAADITRRSAHFGAAHASHAVPFFVKPAPHFSPHGPSIGRLAAHAQRDCSSC
eukprot:365506-Chlamydomonas_euryale.AAC.1